MPAANPPSRAPGTVTAAVPARSSASSGAPSSSSRLSTSLWPSMTGRTAPDRSRPQVAACDDGAVTDFSARMERAAAAAEAAGLAGLLVAPGPDLRYLTGDDPVSAAERLMVLIVRPGDEPVFVLPALEHTDTPVTVLKWSDGEDPYAAAARLLEAGGRYAVSDSCWALHVLGLQAAAPSTWFAS